MTAPPPAFALACAALLAARVYAAGEPPVAPAPPMQIQPLELAPPPRKHAKKKKRKKPAPPAVAPSAPPAPPARPALRRAPLQLIVNGAEKQLALVLLADDDALVEVADLERAGLRSFRGQSEVRVVGGKEYLSLRSMRPRFVYRIDEKALALRLDAQPDLFATSVIDLSPSVRPPEMIYREDTSAFLNYALSLDGSEHLTTFGEVGASFKKGLAYSGFSRSTDGRFVRGLSNVTVDEPDALRRWVAGDVANAGVGSDALGGTLLLGGIGVSREFSLDPYFVHATLPHAAGFVSTPSTVDVYVNDRLVRQEALPPGPFQLENLPVGLGNSSVRYVVRDAFGRASEYASSAYFTSGVLSKGLSDYGYSVGFRRDDLATASLHYGAPALLGRHRLGITDTVTAGARLEAGPGLVSGGPSVTALLPIGEVEFAAALSRDGGRAGAAASAAYTAYFPFASFGFILREMGAHYANTGLAAGDDRAKLNTHAFASVPAGTRLTLVADCSASLFRDSGRSERCSLQSNLRLTRSASVIASAGYSRGPGVAPGADLLALFIYSFGAQTLADVGYTRSGGTSGAALDLQRSLPAGVGLGYRMRAQTGAQGLADADVQYQGPYGRYEVDYQRLDRANSATVSAAGGLVAIGGGFFATRPVEQGYGLIQLPGLPDVRGFLENQEIGRTDSHGDLFVPNLLPYYGNRLRISDEDIPLRFEVARAEETVAAPVRGGALVRFPVRKRQGLTGRVALMVGGKKITPAFGELRADGAVSALGANGEFYLENLAPGRHAATVDHTAGKCDFEVEVPDSPALVVKLGDVTCMLPGPR